MLKFKSLAEMWVGDLCILPKEDRYYDYANSDLIVKIIGKRTYGFDFEIIFDTTSFNDSYNKITKNYSEYEIFYLLERDGIRKYFHRQHRKCEKCLI